MDGHLMTTAAAETADEMANPWLKKGLAAAAVTLLAGAVVLWLCHLYSDFPLGWHPDEPTKVNQLQNPKVRNFFHPQLLLESTLLYMRLAGTDVTSDQMVAEAGRMVTASLTALGVMAFLLAARLRGGMACMLLAFPALVFCPFVVLLGRFLKEEPALLAGLGLTMLALAVVCRKPPRLPHPSRQWMAWGLLGAACGLAASGKYVGLVMVIPALVAAMIVGRPGWKMMLRRAALVTLGMLLVGAMVNYRAFTFGGAEIKTRARVAKEVSPLGPLRGAFVAGFVREVTHVSTAHKGTTIARPNSFVAAATVREVGTVLVILVLSMPLVIWLGRRQARGRTMFTEWDTLWLLTTACWMVMLSMTAIVSARYAQPAIALLCLGAAVSAWRWVELLGSRQMLRWIATVTFAAVIAGANLIVLSDYLGQLRNDSRDQVRQWLAANLPKGASIAIDGASGLSIDGADRPALAKLRPDLKLSSIVVRDREENTGAVTDADYLVVTDLFMDRFTDGWLSAYPGYEESFAQRVAFFRELLKDKPLWHCVWERPSRVGASPNIHVYKLR